VRPGRRCAGRGWGRAGTSSLYQPWTCSSCDRSWGAQLTASPARAANGSSKKTRGAGRSSAACSRGTTALRSAASTARP